MSTKNWLTTKFVAHRGLFDNEGVPENSILAFENAVAHNFAIEVDVQATKDGVLVIFHDDTLDRMTDVEGILTEKTFAELQNLRLLKTQCEIPTFDQLLDCVDGRTELIIEIKTHGNIGEIESQIYQRLKNYKGDFVVESFNPLIIRWFKLNAPEIVRGQLADTFENNQMPFYQKFLLSRLLLCRWNGSQFIVFDVEHMHKRARLLKKWRKKMPLLVYTVRSQQQYEQTKHLYDNMIFDSYMPE